MSVQQYEAPCPHDWRPMVRVFMGPRNTPGSDFGTTDREPFEQCLECGAERPCAPSPSDPEFTRRDVDRIIETTYRVKGL